MRASRWLGRIERRANSLGTGRPHQEDVEPPGPGSVPLQRGCLQAQMGEARPPRHCFLEVIHQDGPGQLHLLLGKEFHFEIHSLEI